MPDKPKHTVFSTEPPKTFVDNIDCRQTCLYLVYMSAQSSSTVLSFGCMLKIVSNASRLLGMQLTRQFREALEEIPNLRLLDIADICHKISNFTS